MNKYFSHVDYFATGEGRLVNIAGGNFTSEEDFYEYLERRIDPFYLRGIDIYTYDQRPEELLNILKQKYRLDLDRLLKGTGIYHFMHEFYLNLS